MAHHVMVGEGEYPIAAVESYYSDHLQQDNWMGDIRLAENLTAIIVDERVKRDVEKRGIPGIFFHASGEWSG